MSPFSPLPKIDYYTAAISLPRHYNTAALISTPMSFLARQIFSGGAI
jgi:hypothetical protein